MTAGSGMAKILAKPVLFSMLAGMLSLTFVQSTLAQTGDLDQAAQAVVRIRACDASGCDRGVGSGVVIDPSGVILTANHVTLSDPDDPLSDPLNDFVIEITSDWRTVPEARYHASLAAADRTNDLALLQVYWDEIEQRNVEISKLTLPALPLAETATIHLGERLHFLGYPLLGGATVNYLDIGLSGFDDDDSSLLKVTGALSPGYSGGPGLVARDDGFYVIGVVSRQRFGQENDSTTGKVSLVRSVDALPGLDWRPAARRVWVDDVSIAAIDIAVIDPDEELFTIEVEVHALDFAERPGRAMAYAYDAASGEPWTPQPSELPTTVTGQAVLSDEFMVTRFLGKRHILLSAPASAFLDSPDELAFRIVLWDDEAERAVWRDTDWRRPSTTMKASQPRLDWRWPMPLLSVPPTATQPTVLLTEKQAASAEYSPTPTLSPTPQAASLAPTAPSVTALPPSPTCRVLVRALRLRAGPDTTNVAKGMLDLNTEVTALARDPALAWIEVRTRSGLRGWIRNSPIYVACTTAVSDLPLSDSSPRSSPTSTSAPAASAGPRRVELLTPADGANSRDPLIFSWQPDASLADGQVYELVFWEPSKGQTHEQGGEAWQDASVATAVTLDPSEHVPETYAWGIWLGVFDGNGHYSRIRYLGGGRSFTVPSSDEDSRTEDEP